MIIYNSYISFHHIYHVYQSYFYQYSINHIKIINLGNQMHYHQISSSDLSN